MGLKVWLTEREADYKAGRVCKRCGYTHSRAEFESGYRDDGVGLCCIGWARIKLEELTERRKLKARMEQCRACGGSLKGGHVDGVCWACYDRGKAQGQRALGPVFVGDLIATIAGVPNILLGPNSGERVTMIRSLVRALTL